MLSTWGESMKVIVFGATGMIGQGVLIECLKDPAITKVLAVGRKPNGRVDPKLEEILHADFDDLSPIADRLAGYDACFFCLGISSVGLDEAAYTRITYDIPLAIAALLLKSTPAMTFIYLSGGGADSSEQGRVMWARVKGKAENAVERLPFKAKFAFRPAYVHPTEGVSTAHNPYGWLYKVFGPLYPLLAKSKKNVTSTDRVGRAMIRAAREGYGKFIVECADINALGVQTA
jgi:uncharacterized protein YbjT (DUF2867 family)